MSIRQSRLSETALQQPPLPHGIAPTTTLDARPEFPFADTLILDSKAQDVLYSRFLYVINVGCCCRSRNRIMLAHDGTIETALMRGR